MALTYYTNIRFKVFQSILGFPFAFVNKELVGKILCQQAKYAMAVVTFFTYYLCVYNR